MNAESMTSRDSFLQNVRRALGREQDQPPTPDDASHIALSRDQVEDRAKAIQDEMATRADELFDALEQSAEQGGWNVVRVAGPHEAARHIAEIARDLEARSILRSTHPVLEGMGLEAVLDGSGISLDVMAIGDATDNDERDRRREKLRRQAIDADMGITGVDYAVAETGTCVLLPRKGLSRLVSLLPPAHVAVVEKGQVLPSLDELFTLRRREFLHENLGSYMNLITGPSRSADIEYQLVTGVHGPGEVHMILVA
ncbi:MAG: lactate utilization protein [Chloroflexi bacterium]|nr:lactate utilization protein [Chloroflexota bacterium]